MSMTAVSQYILRVREIIFDVHGLSSTESAEDIKHDVDITKVRGISNMMRISQKCGDIKHDVDITKVRRISNMMWISLLCLN